MNKPKEIYRTTECEQYEISNYLNLRTLPYRLYRGTNLTYIPSREIPVRVSNEGAIQGMMSISSMKGFKNTHLLPVAKRVFNSKEIREVEAYKEFAPEMLPILKKEFSAGTVRTFRHFKSIKWTSKVPEEGDIVIWQTYKKGKAQTTGHAAIVMEVNGKSIKTIEGNTNDKGGREGYIVASKNRIIDLADIIEDSGFKRNAGEKEFAFIERYLKKITFKD